AGIRPRSPGCLRANGTLDRSQSPRVRDFPYPHPLPGDTALSSVGSAGTYPASQLGSLRHRACGVCPSAHERLGPRSRVRVVLRAAFFAPLNLASPTRRLQGRTRVSGHELSLQAFQSILASADPTPADWRSMAAVDRAFASQAPQVSYADRG